MDNDLDAYLDYLKAYMLSVNVGYLRNDAAEGDYNAVWLDIDHNLEHMYIGGELRFLREYDSRIYWETDIVLYNKGDIRFTYKHPIIDIPTDRLYLKATVEADSRAIDSGGDLIGYSVTKIRPVLNNKDIDFQVVTFSAQAFSRVYNTLDMTWWLITLEETKEISNKHWGQDYFEGWLDTLKKVQSYKDSMRLWNRFPFDEPNKETINATRRFLKALLHRDVTEDSIKKVLLLCDLAGEVTPLIDYAKKHFPQHFST